jgi:hypothetical protein
LGAAAAAASQNPASPAGLAMQIPGATQLSHAAALAAATSQFYEYQVSLTIPSFPFLHGYGIFLDFSFFLF